MNEKRKAHHINQNVNHPIPITVNKSFYITMSDGVSIAIDIWLPKYASADNTVPVMVEFTRYWRCVEGKEPRDRVIYLAECGFASAVVDCRGTGASGGWRHSEQSVAEVRDFAEVIEWLGEQDWSNGSVVSIGSSYSANTAELAMLDAPQSLKASVPRFSDFDIYTNLCFPGGLRNKVFNDPWGEGILALDNNEVPNGLHECWDDYVSCSVKPVSHNKDKCQYSHCIAEHKNNIEFKDFMRSAEFRDEFNFANNLDEDSYCWVSPHRVQNNTSLQNIPSYHWASFNDAGTAVGAIARYMGTDAPMRLVIGWWSHGAFLDTNPFKKNVDAAPSYRDQFIHITNCLSALKQTDNEGVFDWKHDRTIYFLTAGVDRWQRAGQWPPKGVGMHRWYFEDNYCLSNIAPCIKKASDIYNVDFEATTGEFNCWNQTVQKVDYGDRAEADRDLLVYTSTPLNSAIEITGTPVIHLQMSSNKPDGAVIAYLEVVDNNGVVTMLTQGRIRLLHRKVSSNKPPYPTYGPYHSFKKNDAVEMPINKVQYVGFELLPLSVTLKRGDSLRVAIAGHDKGNIERVINGDDQKYEVYRQLCAFSYIEIPVQEKQVAYVNSPFENLCENDISGEFLC